MLKLVPNETAKKEIANCYSLAERSADVHRLDRAPRKKSGDQVRQRRVSPIARELGESIPAFRLYSRAGCLKEPRSR